MPRTRSIVTRVARLGGPKGYAYPPFPRCPACNSQEVASKVALVDEDGTFAVRPQEVAGDERIARLIYRYQEYRYLKCSQCWFT